ncbi:kinesin-like protein KIN-10B isoform X2 [Mangifera indica]|uniref:kinesin-like protein KIN-10B isoform X2 n=1 Tax=Mangifera indica TaxID=29780 RepID=UPI001CF9FB7C|nr:kinesin-like protein KIN-10B isoform X2 [Mangifera indica]
MIRLSQNSQFLLNKILWKFNMETLSTPSKRSVSNSISKVRVVVRVRPFLSQEISAKKGNPKSCISVLDKESGSCNEVTVHLKDPNTIRSETYQLDSIFDQTDDTVSKIFYSEVSPLIPGVFYGCNATVFAYGATGSGKTYTMQGTDEKPGLMSLAMSTILSMCQGTGSTAEISYYEVYMDRCYDLLELKAKEIAILDDKDGQIHLKGLSRVPVNSMTEFQEVFYCGIYRRKVAHTGLNDVSSRSHGVLVISVSTPRLDDSGAPFIGKLNLIDLAGNEDNRRSCNEGIRLLESGKINQSLFALSNVIYALNNNKPRVPYRESKLTRILQDSLGGTSRALMIACLNPGEYHESVHTVSLAARSRHISNSVPSAQKFETPTVKVDMEAKLQAWLESKGKTKSSQRMAAFGSPFQGKAPTTSVKKTINHSSAKVKASTNQSTSIAKDRDLCGPFRNLFVTEGLSDSCSVNLINSVTNDTEETSIGTDGMVPKSTGFEIVVDMPAEEKATIINPMASSPICERIAARQSPLRKALSPVNFNVNPNHHEELSCADHLCQVTEPKTPRTPFTLACANKLQPVNTPLEKFGAQSASLKSSLIQEYIDFLNTASREELLELKGIGPKLADYIYELRETSPLKLLTDLEKIGLSSKQVYNLFNKTAKGIFDGAESATPGCPEIF